MKIIMPIIVIPIMVFELVCVQDVPIWCMWHADVCLGLPSYVECRWVQTFACEYKHNQIWNALAWELLQALKN